VTVPPSLRDPGLDPVWSAVCHRLERSGSTDRGRLRLPTDLSPSARVALAAVLDGPVGAFVELNRLETGLVRLGVADDLPAALSLLGHPVSVEPAERRAARAAAATTRAAVRTTAAGWAEPWGSTWADDVIRAGLVRGLDAGEAVALVDSTRAVLDELAARRDGAVVARTELAARLAGSAHALDRGTRLEAMVSKALAHLLPDVPDRQRWERAGAHRDLVSAPVLTWRLPLLDGTDLAGLTRAADELGVPLHLTLAALRRHRAAVAAGTDVLVTENPSVVEAAARRSVPFAVVATNGNPSGAVVVLLDQLAAAGARLRYHGDFDTAGLAICGRLAARGLEPWHMGAADYAGALAAADDAGVELPRDERRCGPTPWDPALRAAFDADRRIVHEERLLDELLVTASSVRRPVRPGTLTAMTTTGSTDRTERAGDAGIALDPDSPWPKMRGGARQQGRSPQPAVDPGTEPWTLATGKGIFSSPVIDVDGTVYIGSADQRFRAIGAAGTVRWELETGEIVDSAALLDDAGRVIFGSGDGVLYALDRADGSVVWTFAAAPASETGGFISWFEGNVALGRDDLLVVPNDNFRIYGLDRRTGATRWEHSTFDQTWACPAVDPDTGTIFAATNFPFAPNVMALDPVTGQARWSAQTRGSMVASPLLTDDGQMVLGGFDGLVRSFDADTGEARWVAETRDHVYASPALGADGTIVQPGCDGTVYGLDVATGAQRWTFEVGAPVRASAAVDADGHVYVGTGDGRLLVLEPDGRLRWQTQLLSGPRNDLNGSPALGPFGVVLAGESGEVHFVPYEHGLRPEVARHRTTRSPGGLDGPTARDAADAAEAAADDARLLVAERFGSVRADPPDAIDADDPLTLVLRVSRAGRTVLAHLDSTEVGVDVEPPVPVDVDVSGDRTFVVVTPRAPWAPPEGGDIAVRVRAPYLVDPDRDGLVFTGGRPGGVAERDLVVAVRPRPAAPVGLAAGYELYRVAAPLPTILPSYNQIGFDSIHYLLGMVRGVDADGRGGLAWAVGGRLDPASEGAVVDPTANTRFPLEVRVDGDLVTFVNERGFTIEFNGFPLPFEAFRVAARLADDGTGAPMTSPSLVARADADAIDFYGPFLQQLGYCNPTTGLLVVAGAAELRTHRPAPPPEGVTATFRVEAGRVVADVAGAGGGARDARGFEAADHNVGLLVVDEDGHPLPLAYATGTEVTTDDDGRVTSVSVPVPVPVADPAVGAAAPTSAAPTSAAPTSAAPTSAAPTSAAPTSAAPTSAVLLADTTVVATGALAVDG
jgi:uncharacterized protein (TIGR02679 family)